MPVAGCSGSLTAVRQSPRGRSRKFVMPEVDLRISGAITSVSITRRATQVLLVKSVTQSAELSFDGKAVDARTGYILNSGTFAGEALLAEKGGLSVPHLATAMRVAPALLSRLLPTGNLPGAAAALSANVIPFRATTKK